MLNGVSVSDETVPSPSNSDLIQQEPKNELQKNNEAEVRDICIVTMDLEIYLSTHFPKPR